MNCPPIVAFPFCEIVVWKMTIVSSLRVHVKSIDALITPLVTDRIDCILAIEPIVVFQVPKSETKRFQIGAGSMYFSKISENRRIR